MSLNRRLFPAGLGRRGSGFGGSSLSSVVEKFLDYSQATFSRSSEAANVDPREGWAFDTSNPWLSPDVQRMYYDGSILIEGSRQNLVSDWDISTWGSTASLTNVTGPDSNSTGWEMTDASTADLAAGRRQTTVSTSATGAHTLSIYILKDGDSSIFPEVQLLDSTGTGVIIGNDVGVQVDKVSGATNTRIGTPTRVDIHDGGDWWRLEIVVDVSTTGSFTLRAYSAFTGSLGTSDVSVTGVSTFAAPQFELEAFATSPIRTSGTIATRATDVATFSVTDSLAQKLENGFSLDFWPCWNSTDSNRQLSNPTVLNVSSSQYLRIMRSGMDGDDFTLRGGDPVGTQASLTTGSLNFDKHAHLNLTTNAPDGDVWSLEVENVDTGSTASDDSGTPVTGQTLSGETLYIGDFSGTGQWAVCGVVGRLEVS